MGTAGGRIFHISWLSGDVADESETDQKESGNQAELSEIGIIWKFVGVIRYYGVCIRNADRCDNAYGGYGNFFACKLADDK